MLLCALAQTCYITSLWPYQKVFPHLLDPNNLRWHKFALTHRKLYLGTEEIKAPLLLGDIIYVLDFLWAELFSALPLSLWVARSFVRQAPALRSDWPAFAHVLHMTLPLHCALFLHATNLSIPPTPSTWLCKIHTTYTHCHPVNQ